LSSLNDIERRQIASADKVSEGALVGFGYFVIFSSVSGGHGQFSLGWPDPETKSGG
jgi:hypothetical protein